MTHRTHFIPSQNPPLLPTRLRADYDPATTPSFIERYGLSNPDNLSNLPNLSKDPHFCLDALDELFFARTFVSFPEPTSPSSLWLWQDHLPLGTVALLEGHTGTGKTRVALDLAARVSAGLPMPDGSPCQHGPVLYICPEDNPQTHLNLALQASGAYREEILFWNRISNQFDEPASPIPTSFCLDEPHLAKLARVLVLFNPRLVVIDSLNSTLGSRARLTDTALATVFNDLHHMAQEHHTTFLLIRNSAPPQERGRRSLVEKSAHIYYMAKTALLVTPDPLNPGDSLLSFSKHNATAQPPTYRFRVASDPDHPLSAQIQWCGTHSASPAELRAAQITGTPPSSLIHRQVLALLYSHHPTPQSAATMAAALGLKPNTVTQALQRMEEHQRVTSPSRSLFQLTPVAHTMMSLVQTHTPTPTIWGIDLTTLPTLATTENTTPAAAANTTPTTPDLATEPTHSVSQPALSTSSSPPSLPKPLHPSSPNHTKMVTHHDADVLPSSNHLHYDTTTLSSSSSPSSLSPSLTPAHALSSSSSSPKPQSDSDTVSSSSSLSFSSSSPKPQSSSHNVSSSSSLSFSSSSPKPQSSSHNVSSSSSLSSSPKPVQKASSSSSKGGRSSNKKQRRR